MGNGGSLVVQVGRNVRPGKGSRVNGDPVRFSGSALDKLRNFWRNYHVQSFGQPMRNLQNMNRSIRITLVSCVATLAFALGANAVNIGLNFTDGWPTPMLGG